MLCERQQGQTLTVRHAGERNLLVSLQVLEHRCPKRRLPQLSVLRDIRKHALHCPLRRVLVALLARDQPHPQGLRDAVREPRCRGRLEVRRRVVNEGVPEARLGVLVLDQGVDLRDEGRRQELADAVRFRQPEELDEVWDRDRHPAVAAAPECLREMVAPVKRPSCKSGEGS